MTFTSINPTVSGGTMNTVSAEKTRPANTISYDANDIITNSATAGTLWEFKKLARVNGGSGYIVGLKLRTTQKANVAKFRVSLFHTAPDVLNDNIPNKYLYADGLKLIGRVDLPAMSTGLLATADGAEASDFELRIPFVCQSNTTTIWGTLEPLDVFVPDSEQKFYIELTADTN